MKYIQARFILCAMLATSSVLASAQVADWNETDSLANKKDQMVQVAFRKVSQKDLLGGVSVVNVEKLTKKNYNTYSLDNMQAYIGGWNGNSLWGMDADNAVTRGLRLTRGDRNLLPKQIIQQGGFADVRATDDGNKSAVSFLFAHSSSSFFNACSAAACSALRRLEPVPTTGSLRPLTWQWIVNS